MFAGRIQAICLLAGILALGEVGIQSYGMTDTEKPAETQFMEMSVEADGEEADRLTAGYRMLEEEEADCMDRIQEKESVLEAEDEKGQIELMQLNEELRSIRLQKLVLRSRMDALEAENF